MQGRNDRQWKIQAHICGAVRGKVKWCFDRRALERQGDLGGKKYLGVNQMPRKH